MSRHDPELICIFKALYHVDNKLVQRMIVWFFAIWSIVTPESDFGTCTSSVAKSQFKKDSLEKIAKLVGQNFKVFSKIGF